MQGWFNFGSDFEVWGRHCSVKGFVLTGGGGGRGIRICVNVGIIEMYGPLDFVGVRENSGGP